MQKASSNSNPSFLIFFVTSIWNCLNFSLNISKPSYTILHKLHQHPTCHVVYTLSKTFPKSCSMILSSGKSNLPATILGGDSLVTSFSPTGSHLSAWSRSGIWNARWWEQPAIAGCRKSLANSLCGALHIDRQALDVFRTNARAAVVSATLPTRE